MRVRGTVHAPAVKRAAHAAAPVAEKKRPAKADSYAQGAALNRSKNPLRPESKARIVEITFAHPTATNAELAKLFASDASLKGARAWSEEEVRYLRDEAHVVPSERRAGQALGEQLATAAREAGSSTTLGDFIEKLAKRYPRLNRDQVLELTRTDRALAKALQPLWVRERSDVMPDSGPVKLTQAQARQLGFGREVLSRELAGGALVDAWYARLDAVDDEKGLNNDTLRPRDLQHADAMTRRVMEGVYDELGRKQLKLSDVKRVLPRVLGALAERATQYQDDALMPIAQAAATDAVNALSADWRAQVLTRKDTATHFAYDAHKLKFELWTKLREVAPEAFPDPGSKLVGSSGLDAVSALYKDLLAGKLTTGGFYKRAGVSAAELLMLQNADPDRFPRDGDTPYWRTVRGRRNKADAPEVVTDVARGRWGGRGFSLDEVAEAVGERASRLFDKNVLITIGEMLPLINADRAFVKKYGEISLSRYEQGQLRKSDAFPPLKDLDVILPRLAKDVKAVLEKKPGLSPTELVSEMQKQYPSFKLTRVYQLRERFPDLIPTSAGPRADGETRRADALELRDRLEAKPRPTMEQIAAAMKSKSRPYVTVAYLRSVKKSFADEIFAAGAAALEPRQRARSNLGWAKTLELVIRLSPPGASDAQLLQGLNALLEKKGLPGYDGPKLPTNLTGQLETREAMNAAIVSEIAAEYLRAAPEGEDFDGVAKRLLKDYPTLDLQRLSTYRNMWKAHPSEYPALTGLGLHGHGEKIASPRFLGGWDVERALLRPAQLDPELATDLARLSQYTRIENSLPLLDDLVRGLDGAQPLRNKNVLWVTHMLGTTMAHANAMRAAGLSAAKTIVVGSPYGTNDVVRSVLEEDGFDTRVPKLDEKAYHQAVLQGLIDTAARCRKNHEPVVVMDDGGQVTQILNSDPRFKDVLSMFKVVEQTTRGITASEADPLKVPLVSVATSKSKSVEGELVGRSVAEKVVQGLERSGRPVKGLKITLVGYGVVGSKICDALKAGGAHVTVVESTPSRADEARAAGFVVKTKAQALPGCDVVIGATGGLSLELADLESLKDGAAFVSASSKQVETEIHKLKAKATKATTLDPGAPLVHLPNVEYTVKGKHLLALGDGWPINFDGDVEDISPEEIQITRCAMFLGVLQAASMNRHSAVKDRIIPLDVEKDEALYAAYRAFQKKHPPSRKISDPRDWADVLRGLVKDAGIS